MAVEEHAGATGRSLGVILAENPLLIFDTAGQRVDLPHFESLRQNT